MQATESIRHIKDLITKMEQAITKVAPQGGQYGQEEEFTHQELLDELVSILTDLKTLTEKPEELLNFSTYDERMNIHSLLNSCMKNLANPAQLWSNMVTTNKTIRSFNIRHTKERFFIAKNELADLEKEKINLQQTLSAMKRDIKVTEQNKSQSDEILQSLKKQQEELQQQQNDLADKLNQTRTHVQESQNHANTISQFRNKVDSHQPVIDTFVQKIAKREQRLEDQKVKTDTYNSQLIKFTDEHKKRLEEAENLIKKAKTALGYRQAEGISAAFKTRLDKLENVKWWKSANTYWLGMAILLSCTTIWMSFDFIQAIKNDLQNSSRSGITLNWILARFLVFTLPIVATWFCAGQYVKNKNITEDYAYKTILAQSIIGFSEQLKTEDPSDTSYQEYVKKMLDEIHQHPLKNHKKHSTDHSSPIAFLKRSKEGKTDDGKGS